MVSGEQVRGERRAGYALVDLVDVDEGASADAVLVVDELVD